MVFGLFTSFFFLKNGLHVYKIYKGYVYKVYMPCLQTLHGMSTKFTRASPVCVLCYTSYLFALLVLIVICCVFIICVQWLRRWYCALWSACYIPLYSLWLSSSPGRKNKILCFSVLSLGWYSPLRLYEKELKIESCRSASWNGKGVSGQVLCLSCVFCRSFFLLPSLLLHRAS